MATKARTMRLLIGELFLQKIFAEKPQRRQKDDVEDREEGDSLPLYDRLAVQQADADRGANDENGRQQRQKQKWQQKFAHAGLRGDGGKRRAGDRDAQTAQEKNQKQVVKLLENRDVIENGEQRKHQDFGDHQEERVGHKLRKKDGERIADGETQRADRVVVLLAQETRLEHERRSKKNRQPQEAWTEFARLFGRGADGEAEKDEHHKDEDDGGREELA